MMCTMKIILIIFPIILLLTDIPIHSVHQFTSPKSNSKIWGGNITTIEKYPFFVALIWKALEGHGSFHLQERHFSGGSIITNLWVKKKLDLSDWLVRSGASQWNATKNTQKYLMNHDIEQYIVHQKFNKSYEFDYDIALIRVKQPFKNPSVPVTLAGARYRYKTGSKCTAVGFGRSEHPQSTALREVNLKIVAFHDCKEIIKYSLSTTVTKTMMCAGVPEGGRDTCGGDSGGPLLQRRRGNLVLIGLTSFGHKRCGHPAVPGVYTNISLAEFKDWIENFTIKPRYFSSNC